MDGKIAVERGEHTNLAKGSGIIAKECHSLKRGAQKDRYRV